MKKGIEFGVTSIDSNEGIFALDGLISTGTKISIVQKNKIVIVIELKNDIIVKDIDDTASLDKNKVYLNYDELTSTIKSSLLFKNITLANSGKNAQLDFVFGIDAKAGGTTGDNISDDKAGGTSGNSISDDKAGGTSKSEVNPLSNLESIVKNDSKITTIESSGKKIHLELKIENF